MKLIDVINQHRNDFTGILLCEFCGSNQSVLDGYHDERYMNQVIPAIKCRSCEKRTSDVIPEGISDPEYGRGCKVEKRQVTVERWFEI